MKSLLDLYQSLIKAIMITSIRPAIRHLVLFITILIAWETSAQTVSWSDSFEQGKTPTSEQCLKWTSFLDQLGGKSFASVTISGSMDQKGFTIADPAAANQLAYLLYSRTPGSVTSGNHTWTVTECFAGNCGSMSTALSVDGNSSECSCSDKYAIRPHSTNQDWGGLNVDYSCNAASQTMSLVFSSGAYISANGPTSFCEGGSVVLTANADVCEAPFSYLWSNGATTQSITVNQAGAYSVAVSGANNCSAISASVDVTLTDVSVDAGADLIYCDVPMALNAVGSSSGGSGLMVNEVCIYNSPGAWAGADDCSFTTDVCGEGATFVGNSSYSSLVSFSNAVELRYHIYYSAFADATTFRFKLNNHELESYLEKDATGACETAVEGKFPRSFTFAESVFKQYWIEGGDNDLTVEIETPANGIYLAGIRAEVVTSLEKYQWSPVAGLSNASIMNPIANPEKTTTYTVSYTDANGCTATDEVTVEVQCGDVPPVALCKELVVEIENTCEVSLDASAFDAGSTGIGPLKFSVSPAGSYGVGITNILFTVTDANGQSSTCNGSIRVVDKVLPSIETPGDIIVENDPGACSRTLILEPPAATDNCQIKSVTPDKTDAVFAVGETIITWTAKDISGNSATTTQKVIVKNADPVISSVIASLPSVAINRPVTLTTNYSENNVSVATVDWGDFSAVEILDSPAQNFEVSHSYGKVGFYNVTVTITDHCGAVASHVCEQITVFEKGASVSASGWFESRAGNYLKNERAAGKANFSFEAEYKSSSSVPTGRITFKFKTGKLDFRSTELNWLLVEGDRATLMGLGKMNGVRDYSILISTVDVALSESESSSTAKGKKPKKADKIRVKIWDPSGAVVYDTQRGEPDDARATTDIGGGSIEIETKTGTFTEIIENAVASNFGEEASSVYPNPFIDNINIQLNSASAEDVAIQLMDLSGKIVASSVFPVSEDGYYSMDVPENAREGIYIMTIKQGKRVEYRSLVKK